MHDTYMKTRSTRKEKDIERMAKRKMKLDRDYIHM